MSQGCTPPPLTSSSRPRPPSPHTLPAPCSSHPQMYRFLEGRTVIETTRSSNSESQRTHTHTHTHTQSPHQVIQHLHRSWICSQGQVQTTSPSAVSLVRIAVCRAHQVLHQVQVAPLAGLMEGHLAPLTPHQPGVTPSLLQCCHGTHLSTLEQKLLTARPCGVNVREIKLVHVSV